MDLSLIKNANLDETFRYCVLKPNTKIPANSDWPNQHKTFEEAKLAHENDKSNIGLLNGATSNIMDIDCDCSETAAVASFIISSHLASFSRCHDSSHFLMRCLGGGKTIQLKDHEGNSLIELRGDGSQTMIPPSIHPDGQQLSFVSWNENATNHDYDELHRLVHIIAASSLILMKWKQGSRHQLSLALAGLCQSINVSYDEAYDLVQMLCHLANDDESDARLNNVKLTFQRPSHANIGYQGIADMFGKSFGNLVSKYLKTGFGIAASQPRLPSNDNALTHLGTINQPEEVTESFLAERYATQLNGKALYCFNDKHWYLWDGNRWKKDEQRQLLLLTKEFVRLASRLALEGYGRDITNRMLSFESANKLENIEKLAKPELPTRLQDFDTNHMQLCVQNGVIDLKTGNLLKAEPSMMHSKMADVTFDTEARCPRFLKFLDDIFEGDKALVEYIQTVAGYTLTGSTSEQCFFMFLGGGANGKSTLVNILTKLMGEYAVNTPVSTLMASNTNGVGDDLVRLAGARLVTAHESENGQRLAEAKIKSFTGGDEMTGRPLYSVHVSFKPAGKLIITTNNRPEVRGGDDGIWRRIHSVPFNRQFRANEQNRKLMSSLTEELSGILNWAIEGCLKWQSEGLNAPQAVVASSKEYRSEMDTITGFINDECTLAPEARITVSGIYEQYEEWCRSQGSQPQTKIQFGKMLDKLGMEKSRDQFGWHWKGITLA